MFYLYHRMLFSSYKPKAGKKKLFKYFMKVQTLKGDVSCLPEIDMDGVASYPRFKSQLTTYHSSLQSVKHIQIADDSTIVEVTVVIGIPFILLSSRLCVISTSSILISGNQEKLFLKGFDRYQLLK